MNKLQIIKASAGSGKTYNLAKLYIRQLLFKEVGGHLEVRTDRHYHRRILAITFTNKATNEMKERIVKELNQLATAPLKSKYYADYAQQLQCAGDKAVVIQRRAAEALSDLLMNYSTFNVSTIDSFFQTILRTFAHELECDVDYDLQIDAGYVEGVAVNEFLLSLGQTAKRVKDGEVEQWVRDMMRSMANDKKKAMSVFHGDTLRKMCSQLNREFFRAHTDELRAYFFGSVNAQPNDPPQFGRIGRFIKAVRERIKELEETDYRARFEGIIGRHGLKPEYLNQKGMLAFFVKGADMMSIVKGNGKGKGDTFLNKPFDAEKVEKNVNKDYKSKIIDLQGLYDELMELKRDMWHLIFLNKLAASMWNVGLLGVLERSMRAVLGDSGAVLIADTTELINKVIRSKDDVPFMFERIGTVLDNYMIDEFQDTSRKQYENFLPLLEEALSQQEGATNLIIGDGKQAIYRFRNAEPMLFRETLQNDIPQYDASTLETNYRSRRTVVEFNNVIVGRLVAKFEADTVLQETYIGPDASQPEYVQKVDPKKDADGHGRVVVVTTGITPEDKAEKAEKAAEEMVLKMLPAYLLTLHARLGKWSSIYILVDTHKEGGKIVSAIMAHNDLMLAKGREELMIKVASDESMNLSMSPGVNMVIGLLRFIDLAQHTIAVEDEDPDEELTTVEQRLRRKRQRQQRMYSLLHDFVEGMNKRMVKPAEGQRAGEVLKKCVEAMGAADDNAAVERMSQSLAQLLPGAQSEPLALDNIVEILIDKFVLRGNDDHPETQFLLAFIDVVANFVDQKGSCGTVHEFLQYWDARGDKLCVGSAPDDDALQVMTIHKSKGLEGDCVVIPFATWPLNTNPKEYEYWVTREQWLEQGGKELVVCADDDVPPLLPVNKKVLTTISDSLGSPLLDGVLAEQRSNLLLDLMNKTYVALTRPRRELHLFTIAKSSSDDSSKVTVAQLVNEALPSMESKGVHRVEREDPQYADVVEKYRALCKIAELEGEPTLASTVEGTGWWALDRDADTVIPKKEEEKSDDEEPKRKVTQEAFTAMHLRYTPVDIKVKLNDDDAAIVQRELGLRVHRVLSGIMCRDDVERALALALTRGVLTANVNDPWCIDKVRPIVHRMVCDPPVTAVYGETEEPSQATDWWDAGNVVMNERPYVSWWQECRDEWRTERFRADRVVLRPDGTLIVVDYKTGQPGGTHDAEYREQVTRYAREWAGALQVPLSQVRAYLWYTMEAHIARVSV